MAISLFMSTEPSGITMVQLLAEHATLTFLAWSQYNKLFDLQLKVEHSLGDGLYCTDCEGKIITKEMTEQLEKAMRVILNGSIPIELTSLSQNELINHFTEMKMVDKVGVLKTWQDEMVPCVKVGDCIDYLIEPISTDKERLKIFEIRPYNNGLVLRFPSLSNPLSIKEWNDPKTLLSMFTEYREWAKVIGVDNVSKLNELIFKRKIDDIKWVAEGLHDNKLASIADHLSKNFERKRIITIAGPSSSNKTTFAKRLAIALRVNGYHSVVMEMDDFYRDRDDIPFGPDGLQDFEAISALNIPVLVQRIHALIQGETVPSRKFIFSSGKGVDNSQKMLTLPPNSFLIMEGIHGLNPELLNEIGRDKVTPIYVSALTPISVDNNHRFPTSDLRLIRRMIRDYRYRGYSPRKTLGRWTSVRKGEEKNIFPHQANAELFFNSALVYELPVLSIFGKALLSEATVPEAGEDPDSKEAQLISQEARRLLGLLNLFYPVSVEVVPHISCIREFVGGSDLKY